jgi:hypothetical protein
MIFGIQMYHEEMQVRFEYGCDPMLLPLDLKKFPFIFSLMVRWIQMIFDIQMFHEEMQVKFEYGCCPIIIIGEVIALGLRKLIEQEAHGPYRSPEHYATTFQ